MLILGIETSCDETAVGIVDGEGHILADVVHSQVAQHAEFGGVVPEIASRGHIRQIYPVIQAAFAQSERTVADLSGIAVTTGPGLVGGLIVGMMAAKGLAWGAGLPWIGIHHLEGHLAAPFLRTADAPPAPAFPFVCLLVSGGHTLLLLVEAFGQYRRLGGTRDDAVGEAFDKAAQLLGLPYPGGPRIAALAENGERDRIPFPRAMLHSGDLDFSFSGLKTALRSFLHGPEGAKTDPAHVAASFQEAVTDILAVKTFAACEQNRVTRLVVAGGVAANRRLREVLTRDAGERGMELFFPPPSLCTDNGAMIAQAGVMRLGRGQSSGWEENARPTWALC